MLELVASHLVGRAGEDEPGARGVPQHDLLPQRLRALAQRYRGAPGPQALPRAHRGAQRPPRALPRLARSGRLLDWPYLPNRVEGAFSEVRSIHATTRITLVAIPLPRRSLPRPGALA